MWVLQPKTATLWLLQFLATEVERSGAASMTRCPELENGSLQGFLSYYQLVFIKLGNTKVWPWLTNALIF